MRRFRVLLYALLITMGILTSPYSWSQELADRDWVNEHFGEVLDELLPLEEGSYDSLAYRSYRDQYTDTLEYSFVFKDLWDWRGQGVQVTVRVADSISLHDQLMSMHRRSPRASIENLKANLKVREWRLTESSCGDIGKLVSEFGQLTVPMRSQRDRENRAKGVAEITLHPLVHRLEVDISGGNLSLVLTDDDHLVVRWAERARKTLDKCIAQLSAQPETNTNNQGVQY